jgi:hypothetical protein
MDEITVINHKPEQLMMTWTTITQQTVALLRRR